MSTASSENGTAAGNCPSCRRFIGPVAACPYCGGEAQQNRLLRTLRYAALFLGTIGLLLLYLMVADRATPSVRIGSITPMMNFARARLDGRVTGRPYTAPRHGHATYISFVVNDGTGDVRVKAYRDVARALCDQGLVPQEGTMVSVDGQIRVAAGKMPSLVLNSVEHIRIEGSRMKKPAN